MKKMKTRLTRVVVVPVLAAILLVALLGCLDKAQDAQIDVQSLGAAHVPFYTFLEIEDIEADTWYILVDKSDTVNFPHANTNSIYLKQIQRSGVLTAATQWNVYFGVVITVGNSNSTIQWFHSFHRTRTTQFHSTFNLPESGLDLAIITADNALMNVASKESVNTASVTTTTNLESPVTDSGVVTTTAGIGDIIMLVDEVDAGGWFQHLSIGVSYDTR